MEKEIKANNFAEILDLTTDETGEGDDPTGKEITFNSRDDKKDGDSSVDSSESDEVLLTVVIILVVVIVVAVLVILITHFVTKGRNKNKVTVLNTDGQSSALPQESEEGLATGDRALQSDALKNP